MLHCSLPLILFANILNDFLSTDRKTRDYSQMNINKLLNQNSTEQLEINMDLFIHIFSNSSPSFGFIIEKRCKTIHVLAHVRFNN